MIVLIECLGSWRRMRRAAHNGLSAKAAEGYAPLQEKEVIHLVHGLLHEKGNIDPQLRRYVVLFSVQLLV